ncbi:MAG: chemotaxis protein CheX [Planctomycetota bacterium]
MDASLITPFVTSIQNVFSTMLQLDVKVEEPGLKKGPNPTHDVSGIIGMSGEVVGSVVLSFPEDAATSIVSLFCGEKLEATSPDFADAIGELVNMVSGGAKAMFPSNKVVSISTPSVVVGAGHTVARQSDIPCVVIPCSTDCGTFVIEVGLREQPTGEPAAAGAAQAKA